MRHIDWKNYITIHPHLHHGAPCIKGTRIPVATIVASFADGMTPDELIAAFPQLTHRQIQAALVYAAERLQNESENLETDSTFAAMAADSPYLALQEAMSASFAASDWEALIANEAETTTDTQDNE